MYSSLAIANEFIARAEKERRSLTHMQVQKLVYLAQGWSLAVTAEDLIEDKIEAWEFGPVIRKLYDALRHYGAGIIERPIRWGDDNPLLPTEGEYRAASVKLEPTESQIVDKIWETYGKFEAFQLSALTHAPGSPWSKTYRSKENRVIDKFAIWDYFADLAAAA